MRLLSLPVFFFNFQRENFNISTREILDNDQLDTHLLYFTVHFLQSSTCFAHYVLIIRRLNCIDAVSGIVTRELSRTTRI